MAVLKIPDLKDWKDITDMIIRKRYLLIFLAILFIYLMNMFLDVMENDAALYAAVSMEMSQTNHYLEVYNRGADFLDKPPLLFWLASLSFKVFGIHNFTYKLPSILITLLGIYSIYGFTLMWYDRRRASLAALIAASCQAYFLMTNDVKTDTNLVGLMIFAIWQISAYLRKGRFRNLFWGSVGIGGAMLAKGPIGIVGPAIAIGADLLLKRQWKNIFKAQWLILLLIVGIILAPMVYGLYTQFDLHPFKYTYGMFGPSGVKFFFWTQSFGRITGENHWQDTTSFFFFFGSILWDFQPWVFLLFPALFYKVRKLLLQRFRVGKNEEYISTGGFILIFLAFSISHYKLPSYIFISFPLAAIVTADMLCSLNKKWLRRFGRWVFGTMQLFWLAVPVYFIFVLTPRNFILPVFMALMFALSWFLFLKIRESTDKVFIPVILTIISINVLLSLDFYPRTQIYQSSAMAGQYISKHKIPEGKFYLYNKLEHTLDFYSRRIVPEATYYEVATLPAGTYLYTNPEGLKKLESRNLPYRIVKEFPDYHIAVINLQFINKNTREESLKKNYLLEKY